jgi:biopolymer transport protein ExbD
MRFSSSRHAPEQDFELNLASIIDCFTVLITYLLVSASFIALGTFDVNVPTLRNPGDNSPEPAVSLTIRISANHDVRFKLEGAAAKEPEVRVAAADGKLDQQTMLNQLVELKRKWPDLDAAVLMASGPVEYAEIVQIIEGAKKLIPSISLGERMD